MSIRILGVFAFILTSPFLRAQMEIEEAVTLEDMVILNIINPGVDFEFVTGKKTLFNAGAGIGYSGAYDEITVIENNGFNYVIAPFIDLQYKLVYNRERRKRKDKILTGNTGNFVSFRALTRGWSIDENLVRTDDIDFAVGPTWGFQRCYNNVRLLIDLGPQFYFDTKGNSGFFPLLVQVNLGFKL